MRNLLWWLNWHKPKPVRVGVEPCPICAKYQADLIVWQARGYNQIEEVVRREMNSHIASVHYYPQVTR